MIDKREVFQLASSMMTVSLLKCCHQANCSTLIVNVIGNYVENMDL